MTNDLMVRVGVAYVGAITILTLAMTLAN
jgi:uncharacterized protein YjiS (DUF1127 family)